MNTTPLFSIAAGAALVMSTLSAMSQSAAITSAPFGKLKDGRAVELITLRNSKGASVEVANYGCTIVSFNVPDREGRMESIVLGKSTLAEYEGGHPFYGVVAGRYANRIAKGKFTLEGHEYTLHINNGPNHLHGGKEGFDKKLWAVDSRELVQGVPTLTLSYTSPDGEEGYPGTLVCKVTYSFNDAGELRIDYTATTDKATVVNLTNHVMEIPAGRYTPTDADLIPTGKLETLDGTPLDFRKGVKIGERIHQFDFLPLKYGKGYDHNYVIDVPTGSLRRAALVREPQSGRTLECLTTEPAVQLYTMNHNGDDKGRGGLRYPVHGGFCLETQHYPDSPNHPDFPTTVLKPGDTYRHTTVYRAGVEK
jgi:aldose 1-epimerase